MYDELLSKLPTSTGAQRREWALVILKDNSSIRDLAPLLLADVKVATRFLWLLSDVGISDKKYLLAQLPYLLDYCHTRNLVDLLPQFASYWKIVGVPEVDEARAIEYLFKWFNSSASNVTVKSRSLFVLHNLTKKHPDLAVELQSSIKTQMSLYSNDFKRRCEKVLLDLQSQKIPSTFLINGI